MHKPGLRHWTLFLFSLPGLMQGFTHTVAGQVLTGIYAKFFGLSLGALGSAVLICKIFDAVIDPAIGVISDATHRRSGSRKAWVLGGALVTAVALWSLFRPPNDVGIVWFTAWYLVVYVGWTVTEIPYRAWSMEITSDYTARTRIAVWILVMSLIGAVAVFVVPMAGPALGYANTQEFTPDTLAICAVLTAVLLPGLSAITVSRVPDGDAKHERSKENWRELLVSILKNRPLLYLNALFLLQALSAGIMNGIAFLYLDVYMQLGDKLALILVISVPIAVFAAPVWGWLCGRYEKHRTWAIAVTANAIVIATLAIVSPGKDAFVPVLILMLLNFFFGAAAGVAMPALLGDVVDYGRLKFGHDHAGVYYAFYTLIQKGTAGAGMAMGLFLLDLFGFKASGGEQTASAIFGAQLSYAYLPAVLLFAIVPFLLRFPITRARHAEIAAQLGATAVRP